ncbi:MAG: hypothetical protein AAF934_01385 [Bacteroidota bacterium]
MTKPISILKALLHTSLCSNVLFFWAFPPSRWLSGLRAGFPLILLPRRWRGVGYPLQSLTQMIGAFRTQFGIRALRFAMVFSQRKESTHATHGREHRDRTQYALPD